MTDAKNKPPGFFFYSLRDFSGRPSSIKYNKGGGALVPIGLVKVYRQRRKVAAIVSVVLMALMIEERWRNGDATESSWHVNTAAFLYLVSYVTACFYHLKSRQRSAGWLFLLPTGLVALIVYICLEDRSNKVDNVPCSVCQAANFPDDTLCRFCKSPLEAGPSPHA